MDLYRGDDIFGSWQQYQTALIDQFHAIGAEYDFITIDANRSVHEIFVDLRKRLLPIVRGMKPE
jgi:hypothetical protein